MNANEKRVLELHVAEAIKAGFQPMYVFDGERREPARTADEAVKGLDGLDDGHLHFRNHETQRKAWLRAIFGNAEDGTEVVADHSVTEGFSEAMERAYKAMEDA